MKGVHPVGVPPQSAPIEPTMPEGLPTFMVAWNASGKVLLI